MRAVIQRVFEAQVQVDGATVARIGGGLVVLLGVSRSDTPGDAHALAEKVVHLRIFNDPSGRMELSLLDVGQEALVVSQFTLMGDARRGRRPAWSEAAPQEEARSLYEEFTRALRSSGIPVATGVFRAQMRLALVNDGPVTILLDSQKTF